MSETEKFFEKLPERNRMSMAAWGSIPHLSAPIESRQKLNDKVLEMRKGMELHKCPDYWSAYILIPDSLDLALSRPDWDGDRLKFVKQVSEEAKNWPENCLKPGEKGWVYTRLTP